MKRILPVKKPPDHRVQQILDLTNKDFTVNLELPAKAEFLDLHQLLSKVVKDLLEQNFEGLLQALYRIDVSEQKVQQAFASEGDVADAIAELIIEREIQKVETRKKYSN